MATTGIGLFQALVTTFLYLVPAVSLHLLVGGLANPRTEGWEPTERATSWKARYRRGAWWAQKLNLVLLAFFLIETVMFVVLRSAGCDVNASHTTAAADNIALAADRAYTIGLSALIILALAAIPWAGIYLAEAKKNQWPDPKRRDFLVIHLLIVPLALLLMYVAFGALPRTLCPTLGA